MGTRAQRRWLERRRGRVARLSHGRHRRRQRHRRLAAQPGGVGQRRRLPPDRACGAPRQPRQRVDADQHGGSDGSHRRRRRPAARRAGRTGRTRPDAPAHRPARRAAAAVAAGARRLVPPARRAGRGVTARRAGRHPPNDDRPRVGCRRRRARAGPRRPVLPGAAGLEHRQRPDRPLPRPHGRDQSDDPGRDPAGHGREPGAGGDGLRPAGRALARDRRLLRSRLRRARLPRHPGVAVPGRRRNIRSSSRASS